MAPFTTDADLALDPGRLAEEPTIPDALEAAGFEPTESVGQWRFAGPSGQQGAGIPVDLLVPRSVAPRARRRSVDLGVHGRRTARHTTGLEPVLVDHDRLTIPAFDEADPRRVSVAVAGTTALVVAKLHKIHDRSVDRDRRPDRQSDKDAADLYRLVIARPSEEYRAQFAVLARSDVTGPATREALAYLQAHFGARRLDGVEMAVRALSPVVPEDRIRSVLVAFSRAVTAGA